MSSSASISFARVSSGSATGIGGPHPVLGSSPAGSFTHQHHLLGSSPPVHSKHLLGSSPPVSSKQHLLGSSPPVTASCGSGSQASKQQTGSDKQAPYAAAKKFLRRLQHDPALDPSEFTLIPSLLEPRKHVNMFASLDNVRRSHARLRQAGCWISASRVVDARASRLERMKIEQALLAVPGEPKESVDAMLRKLVNYRFKAEDPAAGAFCGLDGATLTGMGLDAREVGAIKQAQKMAEAAASSSGQASAGAGAGAAPGVVGLFKSKLAVCRITAPHEHIIARLITHFGNSMTLAASAEAPPDAALDLYRAAEMMPGSKTLRVIANELKLSVNGPLRESDPHIVGAVDLKGGKLLVIKVLMTHKAIFQQAAKAELFAVERLSLNAPTAPLVKTKVVEYDVPKSDVHVLGVGYGARKLLLMPWFAGSLANLPQLSTSLIAQGVQRMEEALVYMHECGLAHMDVKPGNILSDVDGQWFLGDFGASLLVGSAVPFGMRTVYPGTLPTKASALIDWRQLVVTIAMLLDKKNIDGIMAQTSAAYTPSPAKVKALCDTRCQGPEDKDLQDVMCRLYERSQWEELHPGGFSAPAHQLEPGKQ